MRKATVVALFVLALVPVISGLALADEKQAAAATSTWKGELVDVACYVPRGAKGAGHADCAKKCVQGGHPLGLLTSDGDLLLLVADHEDGKAFDAAKALAGSVVEVTGELATRGDMKVVTVSGVKAAA
jgi:hypothetical protein